MNTRLIDKLNVGDRITFRATIRGGNAKAARVVTGFQTTILDERTHVLVKFNGWAGVLVRPGEILMADQT
mgnify:CR=1 FL=1